MEKTNSKPRKKQNSLNGSAFIIVITVMTICSAIMMMLTAYQVQNALLTRVQRERMQAYYIMYSGLELAKSALLQENVDSDGNGVLHKLLKDIAADPVDFVPLTQVLDEAELGRGRRVTVRVEAITSEGDPYDAAAEAAGEEVWVKIFAVGEYIQYSGSTVDKITEYAGSIYMFTDIPGYYTVQYESPLSS